MLLFQINKHAHISTYGMELAPLKKVKYLTIGWSNFFYTPKEKYKVLLEKARSVAVNNNKSYPHTRVMGQP